MICSALLWFLALAALHSRLLGALFIYLGLWNPICNVFHIRDQRLKKSLYCMEPRRMELQGHLFARVLRELPRLNDSEELIPTVYTGINQ